MTATMTKTRRAAIYTRISSDPRGEQAGVTRQEEDCRELVERNGWELAAVLSDNDISAYSGKPRPGYTRLLEGLKSGEWDAVVAWHPDRLHRAPRELEDFIDSVERSEATVQTVRAGEYDLATPSGRMSARIVGAVARGESEHKSDRLRRKHLQLAQQGKVSGGGTRPFGFESDRVTVRESEARIIRDAAARLLAGESVRSITASWNTAGIATVKGARWTPAVVRRLLKSGRVAGKREHRGEIVGDAVWPAILDEDTHRKVRALLTDKSRRKNDHARSYLLTGGIAVCGLCEAKLVSRPRSDGERCYVCATGPGFHGCGKIRVLSDPLEGLVVEALLHTVDTAEFAEAIARRSSTDDNGELERQITELEKSLEELTHDFYVDRALPRGAFLKAKEELESRLEAARTQQGRTAGLDVLNPFTGRTGALREAWPSLPFDRQRSIIGEVVESVVVGPAVRGRNKFDPDRVNIHWRA